MLHYIIYNILHVLLSHNLLSVLNSLQVNQMIFTCLFKKKNFLKRILCTFCFHREFTFFVYSFQYYNDYERYFGSRYKKINLTSITNIHKETLIQFKRPCGHLTSHKYNTSPHRHISTYTPAEIHTVIAKSCFHYLYNSLSLTLTNYGTET